jgi:hypothetical protein
MNQGGDKQESGDESLLRVRRPRVSILELMWLVAALGVCFRWPGLGLPVGLLFLYAFARRREILRRPTRLALGQIALALNLPPAMGLLAVPPEGLDSYLEYFSFMPTFVPGALIAITLPWLNWNQAPLFSVEIRVLSVMSAFAVIGALGKEAKRGRAWSIACFTLAVVMSAASTFVVWALLHAGA